MFCYTPRLYICSIVAAWHNYGISTGSTSNLQVQLLSRLALKANRTPKHLPSRRFLANHLYITTYLFFWRSNVSCFTRFYLFSDLGWVQTWGCYPSVKPVSSMHLLFDLHDITKFKWLRWILLTSISFLTCAQVRSSMEMLSGMCQWHSGIKHAPKYLEGNQWGWCQQLGETNMLQWKSSYQNHRMPCILHIFKDPNKLPRIRTVMFTPHEDGVANRRHNRISGKSPKNDDTDLQNLVVKMDIFTQNQFQRLFQLFHSKDYSKCMSKCVKPFQTFTQAQTA